MKIKLNILIILLVMFIPMVLADTNTQSVSDVFQVNSQIQYTKPCYYNGSYCSDAATCNYTFYDRDSSILMSNIESTSVGINGASLWETNISRGETGIYKIDFTCCDLGLCSSETLYYEITGDGRNNSVAFYIIILAISFIIMGLGFLIPDGWITVLGTFGLYFTAIEILRFGIVGIKNLTSTWAIGIILLAVAMYVSIKSSHEMITD